jgi:hypothetical protein
MTLAPNSPAKRLKWVCDTYWKKDPYAVAATYEVARHLFGVETNRTLSFLFDNAANALAADELDAARDIYTEVDRRLPPRHENDFLIPWAARELARLNVALGKGEIEETDREDSENLLTKKGPAIAMWAKRERKDILKVSLAEALEAVAEVEIELKGGVPQGVVVHRFDDGWTVQELRAARVIPQLVDKFGIPAAARMEAGARVAEAARAEREALETLLEAEGEVMQHCVGDYGDNVLAGESRIYSIRDPKGRPHVTLEWRPTQCETPEAWSDMSADRFMGVYPRPGYFAQVMGKQNDKIAEKYRPYAIEFISKRFNNDAVGLFLAGKPPPEIDFRRRGKQLFRDVEIDWTGADLRGADLSGMDLTNVDFRDVNLTGGDLEGAIGRDAMFQRAKFTGTDVRNFDVRGADLTDSTIGDATNVSDLLWDDATSFNMTREQKADAFGVMWDHSRKEYREVVWDGGARGYVWADEVEGEPEDDDSEPEADELEANANHRVELARLMAAKLLAYMPETIARDVTNNAAVGISDEDSPALCLAETLRHRLAVPGATMGRSFPALTAQQIQAIINDVDDDEEIRRLGELIAQEK